MSLGEWVRCMVWPRRGLVGWLGYLALRPLSLVFGLGVALRGLAYRMGLFRVHTCAVPVVSIGNLAVGGTGKTPFSLWLARQLAERGVRVGIVSRGYGGKRTGPTVVSSGTGPELGPDEVGDEAVMLARSFPGPVVIAQRRVEGVELAAQLGCDLVLLDDGFQHRALARAFDIVMIDGRRGGLLPSGPFREPLLALRRADAVVLVDRGSTPGPALPRRAAKKPSYRMVLEPRCLVESVSGRWRERALGLLGGTRVLAVSGVARPDSFYDLIRRWEGTIDEVFEFPDHHSYTHAEWQEIVRRSHRVDLVVTTEKDLVKLEAFPFANGKLVALRIEPKVERSDELVDTILQKVGWKARGDEVATVAEGPAEGDETIWP